jgi:hypothetical protein
MAVVPIEEEEEGTQIQAVIKSQRQGSRLIVLSTPELQ